MRREAFDELVALRQSELFAFLLARCPDREAAQDALQDVLVQAWRHRERLAGMDADGQGRYLFASARNRSRDSWRALRTRRARQTVAMPAQDPAADGAAPEDPRLAVLARCIAALPAERRELAHLAWVAGLDGPAIAARLGRRPGTIRSQLSRLRVELRAAVARELQEERA